MCGAREAKTKVRKMKIKAKIVDVVMANKMIREMQSAGLDPDQMLEVIKLARQTFELMENERN